MLCVICLLLLVGFYWMYFFEYELISASVPSGGVLTRAFFYKARVAKDNNANNNYFIYLVIIPKNIVTIETS